MLRWSLAFFIVAIIAAVFGFGGIAAGATEIAYQPAGADIPGELEAFARMMRA